jgi:phasin family protein
MTMRERVRDALKPASDLVVLNAETTGRLIQQQTALVLEVTEASVAQVRKLMAADSVREAYELQRDYVSDVFSMARGTGREQIATLREAGSDAGSVLRGAFRSVREEAAEAVEPAPEQPTQPAAV